jgi:hypothetical protein
MRQINNMANHDRLYYWWWSSKGPGIDKEISIDELNNTLLKAKKQNIVSGKNEDLTYSGWNYAVLNFILKYCSPGIEEKSEAWKALENNNNQIGNYGIWKKYLDFKVKVINKLPNFWWVNQGGSYNTAMGKKFLQCSNIEEMPFHWESFRKVKKGDIFFNYAYKKIQGVSIAESDCYEEVDNKNEYKDKYGNLVRDVLRIDTKHFEFENKIELSEIKKNIDEFSRLLGEKFSPFNKNGEINQGYLYKINYDAAKLIRKIYNKRFPEPIEKYFNIILEPDGSNITRTVGIIFNKKQIILYGPPGTGKTFNTKEIAVNILNKNNE